MRYKISAHVTRGASCLTQLTGRQKQKIKAKNTKIKFYFVVEVKVDTGARLRQEIIKLTQVNNSC